MHRSPYFHRCGRRLTAGALARVAAGPAAITLTPAGSASTRAERPPARADTPPAAADIAPVPAAALPAQAHPPPPLADNLPARADKTAAAALKSAPGSVDASGIMRVIPKTPRQQVAFFRLHLPRWAASPEAFGLTPAMIAQIEALLVEAEAAMDAANKARIAARSLTQGMEDAAARLCKAGSAVVATIKLTARDNPVLLAAAQIDPPDSPSEAPAPQAPINPVVMLDQFCSVRLEWETRGPTGTERGDGARGGGTHFVIYRQGPGEPTRRIVGVTTHRFFVDERPPLVPGATINYFVKARRAGKESASSTHTFVQLPAVITTNIPAAAPQVGRRAA